MSEIDSITESVSAFALQDCATPSIADRIVLLQECVRRVGERAQRWAQLAADSKGSELYYAGDMLSGPCVVLRQLQLTIQTLRTVDQLGQPHLPSQPTKSKSGKLCIPVFPTKQLNDRLLFSGIKVHARYSANTKSTSIHGDRVQHLKSASFDEQLTLILGAGNVSSIPGTDTLSKIFFDCQRVVLKMNPVNAYLTGVFESVFEPLVRAKLLLIVEGGTEVGKKLLEHPKVNRVHITGSDAAHDAIVWGDTDNERRKRKAEHRPLLKKPITSELGNVSPWIVTPGDYSKREIDSQAKHIANSITNNASFNCLATKVIITCEHWPQRRQFLDRVQAHLRNTPLRPSYYPGAEERYARFASSPVAKDANGCLPWCLVEDLRFEDSPHHFTEESFVAVCAETQLPGGSPEEFLRGAIEFANQKMTGTLCASLTIPRDFGAKHGQLLDNCIDELRYGTVCVNQWSGLSYALISPAWGAFPGATIDDPQSGIGSVHNTFLLDGFEKSVLSGPLIDLLKPAWFADHRKSRKLAEHLVSYYTSPSLWKLSQLSIAGATG